MSRKYINALQWAKTIAQQGNLTAFYNTVKAAYKAGYTRSDIRKILA